MRAAFEAAAEAAAALHGVEVEHVRAATRGRGYKPPVEITGTRKLAIWLTVAATQCTYAQLARAIGMHKDTVCSHCADVREMSMDDDLEALAEAMRTRLVNGIAARTRRWRAQQILLRHPATHPTISDETSEDEKKIISLKARRRA